MNSIATMIRNRLSLRLPQEESLDILSTLADQLTLKKNANLEEELQKVRSAHPTCINFERTFPNICFSLATGVGKTRLMGAFITYLYLSKKIKNFFVLAPNLTVYNKLIEDFGNPNHPKYVFQGIGEFATHRPKVVTGDNYQNAQISDFYYSEVTINVFNISKINAETRSNKEPRIKRLSEYIGDSYFNYLANLPDLVLLMDESHHYRADRGLEVINELNPILGLEVTATPQVERNNKSIKFQNVVYEYSLAKAIHDGFVKIPAVATRKDFNPENYKAEELDRIKLEDGIRIHEDTKVALDIYARDYRQKPVKPFVLVVAQNTDHAGRLMEQIKSDQFFGGYYQHRVMEIHSNQSGSEKDENIAKLVTLESPDNDIEIVIHVNMLKEGWDVTNLYTLIPLRTAASMTLREQTIGRGLRLPYGVRTGEPKIDKLTIIAHDRFQEIVDAANAPDSIIRLENIIEIDPEEIQHAKEVFVSPSLMEIQREEEKLTIAKIENTEDRHLAELSFGVNQIIQEVIPMLSQEVTSMSQLKRDEVKSKAFELIENRIREAPQQSLFAEQMIEQAKASFEQVVDDYVRQTIPIPRITIQQSDQAKAGFRDFDLDVRNFSFRPLSEDLIRKILGDPNAAQEVLTDLKGQIVYDRLDRLIVTRLMDYPEIDYDDQSDLLFKLARQALEKMRTYLSEDDVRKVVKDTRRKIADFIYAQMREHFYIETPKYEKPILTVKAYTEIREHNYTKDKAEGLVLFTETVTPVKKIPDLIFFGFKKSCHLHYKFDSKTEKDMAIILEQDNAVLRWLRPARGQFNIYWHHNSRQYVPDFVVETQSQVFIVETKKASDVQDSSAVQEKAVAASNYCKYASEFNKQHGGKQWQYILIPHNEVQINMSVDFLTKHWAWNSLKV